MTRSRRVWIRVLAVVLIVTAALVIRNQLRVAANRQMRRAEASRRVQARTELFAEIQPVNVTNCELKRFGEPHDGGYPLCVNLLSAVKAGYSYGISGYDGWGCDVSRQLHVAVHQYDCFDLRVPSCPGGSTVFHGECIAPTKFTEDGRPFDTFSHQFAGNGHADVPLVKKIDVEFHHVDDPKYVETMRRLKHFFYIAHLHYNNFSCDPEIHPFPSW